MSTITDSDKNAMMVRIAPELESKWATYPLQRKFWLDASATLDTEDGSKSPVFISYKKDPNFPTAPLKADYVWGSGPRGFGYYHLLTRESYITLNARVRNNRPPMQCCCFGGGGAQAANDYEYVSEIVYNRSVSSTPDDVLAYKEAINIARGEAQMHYNMSQDVQLVVNMASAVF
eukprot:259311_1